MYEYIQKILERIDLQEIRNFLIYNGDLTDPHDFHSYAERLEIKSSPIDKRLKKIYKDADELDDALSDLSDATSSYQNVFFELGMKAGARLLFQLLCEKI